MKNPAYFLIIFWSFSCFLFPQKNDTSGVKYLSNTDSIHSFLASPEGKGIHPALIIIHEWWGLDGWIKQNTEDFAQKGYVALAVDLYRGKVTSSPGTAHELSRALPQDRAMRDIRAAYDYLLTRPDVDTSRIGVIGWCMGGGYSLNAAAALPGLKACVVAYGSLFTSDESAKKVNAPVLGIFGEKDAGIPPEDVRQFEKLMKDSGKQVEVHIYPASGHAFMNPGNKTGYNKTTSQNAWKEINKFLDEKLKSD